MTNITIPREVVPLPCPFCGHTDMEVVEGSTFRWVVAQCCLCGAQAGEVRVQTLGSGTPEQWKARAEEDATKEWNRCAAISAAAEPVANALDALGCERIREYYAIGPAQRAAVESFADALQRVRPVQPLECPERHALWLFWPKEQSGFDHDSLSVKSAKHCEFCEKATAAQLKPLGSAFTPAPAPVVPDAAEHETQGERAELIDWLEQSADQAAIFPSTSHEAKRYRQAAALLAAGPARVEPMTQKGSHED